MCRDIWNAEDKFDNSNYPENLTYFYKTNKKVIGKFKDEASGLPVIKFVSLRSKMHSSTKYNEKSERTATGIENFS